MARLADAVIKLGQLVSELIVRITGLLPLGRRGSKIRFGKTGLLAALILEASREGRGLRSRRLTSHVGERIGRRRLRSVRALHPCRRPSRRHAGGLIGGSRRGRPGIGAWSSLGRRAARLRERIVLPDQASELGERIGIGRLVSTAAKTISGKGSVLVTISHRDEASLRVSRICVLRRTLPD